MVVCVCLELKWSEILNLFAFSLSGRKIPMCLYWAEVVGNFQCVCIELKWLEISDVFALSWSVRKFRMCLHWAKVVRNFQCIFIALKWLDILNVFTWSWSGWKISRMFTLRLMQCLRAYRYKTHSVTKVRIIDMCQDCLTLLLALQQMYLFWLYN